MSLSRTLSIQEAAVLAGVSEKKIRHEIADDVIVPVRDESRVRLPVRTLLFLRLIEAVPLLSKEDRRDLFVLSTSNRSRSGEWVAESRAFTRQGEVPTRLDVGVLLTSIARQLWTYVRGQRRIEKRPEVLGGEPVFAGTRVSVRHVGALAKKLTREQLRKEFPRLSADDISFAALYAQLPMPVGRPTQRLELRRRARPRDHR
jgi:uncharacterized protein (DUF433 family)